MRKKWYMRVKTNDIDKYEETGGIDKNEKKKNAVFPFLFFHFPLLLFFRLFFSK